MYDGGQKEKQGTGKQKWEVHVCLHELFPQPAIHKLPYTTHMYIQGNIKERVQGHFR